VIEKSVPGERMDTFLRAQFPAVSRGAIQRLIGEGHILINGKPARATQTPRASDVVEITWPEARPLKTLPEVIPLSVLYEDRDLIVLDKPAGLVVHPSSGHEEHTLVNALLHHCKGELSGIGGVARPGIVHRLDKDTSGCIVVAKNDAAHLGLATQFAQRQLDKEYLAIVCGQVPHDAGEIRAAIARHPGHRKRMAVRGDAGREAWTSYRVRQRLRGATFVEIALHTGRTHQIRVHFQHFGYPVFGDLTYGKKQTARLAVTAEYEPPRLLLHSWRLSFKHPRTTRLIEVEAPIPADFRDALNALGQAGF
jgi:23S rRNA pseudouridine1911/1915/1917 synthase